MLAHNTTNTSKREKNHHKIAHTITRREMYIQHIIPYRTISAAAAFNRANNPNQALAVHPKAHSLPHSATPLQHPSYPTQQHFYSTPRILLSAPLQHPSYPTQRTFTAPFVSYSAAPLQHPSYPTQRTFTAPLVSCLTRSLAPCVRFSLSIALFLALLNREVIALGTTLSSVAESALLARSAHIRLRLLRWALHPSVGTYGRENLAIWHQAIFYLIRPYNRGTPIWGHLNWDLPIPELRFRLSTSHTPTS